MLFTMLSGRLIHEGGTQNEALMSAMTNPSPPLRSVAPHVSAALAQIVDRAVAFDKEARFADARELQEAVRVAYQQSHHQPIATAPKPFVPDRAVHTNTRSLADLSDDDGLLETVALDAKPALPRTPTTGGAGVSVSEQSPVRRPSYAGWAAAVLSAAVLCGVLVFVLVHRSKPAPTPASASSPAPALVHSDPVTTASTEPVIVAPPSSDVPSAATTTKPTPTVKPPVATATPHDKPNCTPPFVIDPATGKKTWKVECL
jgi:serine/threonine-protein kinase